MTGAPKLWAIRFIEEEERSSRRWYGGAIGRLTFDGNMNTGLTLRTIRMQDGIAEIRAGATLLYDSDPEAEEDETQLKAAALFTAIRGGRRGRRRRRCTDRAVGRGRKVLLIDHEDLFVHTLAGYIRTHRRRGRDHAPRLRPHRVAAAAARPISSCCRRGPAGPRISRCATRSTC